MIKKVAVVSDISGLGKCSLSVAIPILSVMGVQACPLPTAVLSNQTGYESYFMRDFTDCLDEYISHWQRMGISFDMIYTGFLTGAAQADKIAAFIKIFKTEKTKVLVDPVLGDDGMAYPNFGQGLADKYKSLMLLADIITPNLTESCILTSESYDYIMGIQDEALFFEKIYSIGERLVDKGIKTVVITGIRKNGFIYNLAVESGRRIICKSKEVNGSFSGTGDIFASILCAMLSKGSDIEPALNKAADFVALCIKETLKHEGDRNDGVDFEPMLHKLI